MNEVLEGNVEIAKALGNISDDGVWVCPFQGTDKDILKITGAIYPFSTDLTLSKNAGTLLKVIEFFENQASSSHYTFNLAGLNCYVIGSSMDEVVDIHGDSKLDAFWKAAVEFSKLINKGKIEWKR